MTPYEAGYAAAAAARQIPDDLAERIAALLNVAQAEQAA